MIAELLRISIVLAAALAGAFLLPRAAAATRHLILMAGLIAALGMPFATLFVPTIPISWMAPDLAGFPTVSPRGTHSPSMDSEVAQAQTKKPLKVLPIVWIAGTALLLSIRVFSWVRAVRVMKRAKGGGDILFTSEIDHPAAFQGAVILPIAAAQWDAERLALVLRHERAHVRRHDAEWQFVADVVCAVYWFHPLAWLCARRAAVERERACDDLVLADGVSPDRYADALISVAGDGSGFAPAMAERTQLEERVRAMIDESIAHRPSRIARAAVIVAAMMAVPILAAIAPAVLRPTLGEPDLLGDAIASPFSERIGGFDRIPVVPAVGEDRALIALLTDVAAKSPRSDIDFVPERARWALAQVRDGRLVPSLVAALDDTDWRVRAYAAWALGLSRDRRATLPLLALIDHPVWRLRAMAAHALAQIADPSAGPAMRRALSDPAWQVRVGAVRYLGNVDARGNQAILEAMRDDRHMAVRSAAEEEAEE